MKIVDHFGFIEEEILNENISIICLSKCYENFNVILITLKDNTNIYLSEYEHLEL